MVDLEGIRFGFLTCYDFYFPEMLAFMAKRQPDILIGCSHQRGNGRTCSRPWDAPAPSPATPISSALL